MTVKGNVDQESVGMYKKTAQQTISLVKQTKLVRDAVMEFV